MKNTLNNYFRRLKPTLGSRGFTRCEVLPNLAELACSLSANLATGE